MSCPDCCCHCAYNADLKVDALTKENSELREQMKSDVLRIATLQSQASALVGALENLKRQNHHTIEEEMWRIDEALDNWRKR